MRRAKKRRGEESEQKTRFPLTNLQFALNNAWITHAISHKVRSLDVNYRWSGCILSTNTRFLWSWGHKSSQACLDLLLTCFFFIRHSWKKNSYKINKHSSLSLLHFLQYYCFECVKLSCGHVNKLFHMN